jgi:hypothetical protein
MVEDVAVDVDEGRAVRSSSEPPPQPATEIAAVRLVSATSAPFTRSRLLLAAAEGPASASLASWPRPPDPPQYVLSFR